MFCAQDDASHFHMASINYTLNGYPNGFTGDLAAAYGYTLPIRSRISYRTSRDYPYHFSNRSSRLGSSQRYPTKQVGVSRVGAQAFSKASVT